MGIKQTIKACTIAVSLMVCTTALAWKGDSEIKVMTQNQYLGADLVPLLAAPAPEFNAALISVLTTIANNRFRDRVQRQAAQIAKEHPYIVALQEVWRFECQDFTTSPGLGCDDASIKGAFVDHLQETLLALKAQGQKYRVVASVKNLDVSVIQVQDFPAGIPFVINKVPAVLNTVDRDVILARADIPAWPVDYATVCPSRNSLDGCNYQTAIVAATPVGSLPILRGFVAADAKVRGKDYRVVNTHLEVRDPDPSNTLSKVFQAAQAMELIQTLQATTPSDRPLLLLGDINSSPEDQQVAGPLSLPPPFNTGITPPYWQFVDAGYTDSWTLRHHVTPGYTCCQKENLLNKRSELYERIDYIFSKQDTWGEDIHLVGIRQSDKTLPPAARLWPSDHAGLVGALHFWE